MIKVLVFILVQIWTAYMDGRRPIQSDKGCICMYCACHTYCVCVVSHDRRRAYIDMCIYVRK